MISKIKKAQKTTPNTKKKKIKNLNIGSYDKFEENIPLPTFRVDFKKIFWKFKKSKNQPQKFLPKLPKT